MTVSQEEGVSVDDETLDQLVQEASVPTLAQLFKRAKEAGVIGPVTVYGEGGTGFTPAS